MPAARGLRREFGGLTPFGSGRSQKCGSPIQYRTYGRVGLSFEYSYETGSRNSRTLYFQIVTIEVPVYMPWLLLTPAGVMRTVVRALGGQDVQFTSQAFNDAWRIRAASDRVVFDYLSPRLMSWLMMRQGRTYGVVGNHLYTAVSGQADLRYLDSLVVDLAQLYDRVRGFVWEYGSPAPPLAGPCLTAPPLPNVSVDLSRKVRKLNIQVVATGTGNRWQAGGG